MLMVRQPISLWLRIVLGVTSILLLIAMYWFLSVYKQQSKRAEAYEKLVRVREQLVALEALPSDAIQSTDDESAQEGSRVQKLRELEVQLERESREAIDRTMPTLDSLFRDGLLYALKHEELGGTQYWLWDDTVATAKRLVAGLVLGVLLSVVLGILMGAYSPIEAFFVPPLSYLAKIPPTAMLVVFFVLVGVNFRMYVTMIVFGVLPTLAQTVYQSAKKDVPESLVFKAYTLGASHIELIWNVIYKQILPRLIDAIRLQIGPAMVLLVAAEWMVAGEGFGYRLRLYYQRTDMTVVYVYLILLGIAGLTVDYALIWFRRLLCPWFGE